MAFEGHDLRLAFRCMGANMQPQRQVQILPNVIDRAMNSHEAIDAPHVRALGGRRISIEQAFASQLVNRVASVGHHIIPAENAPVDWLPHEFARSFQAGAQGIAIDRELGALGGVSDPRPDGAAIGH